MRGTKPRVVVGNGFCRLERLLLESELLKPWANGAEVNSGVPDALPLYAGL